MKIKNILKMFLVTMVMFCFYAPSLIAANYTYSKIFMTSEEGNTTAIPDPYTYDWTEQPWLYLQLNNETYDTKVGSSVTDSTWTWINSTGGPNTPWTMNMNGTSNGLWTSFNSDFWKIIKQPGDWTINVNTTLFKDGVESPDIYEGSTSFKLVPEPASMILYILGGLSLASGFFRKKKS
ncbi:MAG: PEP-CTERM sorting domain-containing protein [Candidatus Omnitrophota bacterium]